MNQHTHRPKTQKTVHRTQQLFKSQHTQHTIHCIPSPQKSETGFQPYIYLMFPQDLAAPASFNQSIIKPGHVSRFCVLYPHSTITTYEDYSWCQYHQFGHKGQNLQTMRLFLKFQIPTSSHLLQIINTTWNSKTLPLFGSRGLVQPFCLWKRSLAFNFTKECI